MPSFAQPVKRAKSRLQRSATVQRQPDWRPTKPSLTTKARSRLKKHFSKRSILTIKPKIFRKGVPRFLPSVVGIQELFRTFLLQRLPFLPVLGFSLIILVTSGFFFTTISPQIVSDIPASQAYGPAILLIFLMIATLAIFLFAHIRRGTLVSLCATTFILLHLQDFKLDTIQIGAIICFYLIIEVILSLLEKWVFSDKTFPQHRRRKV